MILGGFSRVFLKVVSKSRDVTFRFERDLMRYREQNSTWEFYLELFPQACDTGNWYHQQGGLGSEKKYLGSIFFFLSPGGKHTYHIIRHITIYGNSRDLPIVETYQDYLLHGFLWLISTSVVVYLCLVVYICTYYNKSQTFIAWIVNGMGFGHR